MLGVYTVSDTNLMYVANSIFHSWHLGNYNLKSLTENCWLKNNLQWANCCCQFKFKLTLKVEMSSESFSKRNIASAFLTKYNFPGIEKHQYTVWIFLTVKNVKLFLWSWNLKGNVINKLTQFGQMLGHWTA